MAPAHQVRRSVRAGSYFEGSKLLIPDILLLTHLLIQYIEHTFIMRELGVSSRTVCDWHNFIREVCMKECLRMNDHIGEPGVIVWSNCLQDKGFVHLTVNHSLNFKNPDNDVHTNAIKGTWSAIKRTLPTWTVGDNLDLYFAEYMWRRNRDKNTMTINFLEAAARVYILRTRDIIGPKEEVSPKAESDFE